MNDYANYLPLGSSLSNAMMLVIEEAQRRPFLSDTAIIENHCVEEFA